MALKLETLSLVGRDKDWGAPAHMGIGIRGKIKRIPRRAGDLGYLPVVDVAPGM